MRRLAAVFLAICLTGLVLGSPVDAHQRRHVLAHARLTPAQGGEVRASDGWSLYVLPHTVDRSAVGSITALGHGVVDIHIAGPWHGKVRVTSPPILGHREMVAHKVGGLWFPEGSRHRQRSVWVDHLSAFSLSGLLGDVEDGLCLTAEDPIDLGGCLLGMGIKTLSAQAAEYLAGKVDGECLAALTTDPAFAIGDAAAGGGVGDVPLAALETFISSDAACTKPGDGASSIPGSAPPLPVSGEPVAGAQQGTVNPQGGTGNPQPPTVNPQPPAAGAEPIFTVMNTSETPPDGVWFRNGPESANTDRVTGHGVYMGEQVQLICYEFGEAVGPYTDSLWYYVVNVSRPTNGGVSNSGFLNAHYINDGKIANEIDPGVSHC
jgi:hypothetical protein